MIKRIILALIGFLLFPMAYAKDEINCDYINQFKVIHNSDISYLCNTGINGYDNYIIVNDTILSHFTLGTIWEYTLSKNNSIAVSFSSADDIFTQYVYLDNKKVGNYKYYSHLQFSNKDNSLYFVSGDNNENKLIQNGKDITPPEIKRIHTFHISPNGDTYLFGCDKYEQCSIYKNLQMISSSANNLVVKNEFIGYIKSSGKKNSVIINDKEIYTTYYELGNLSLDNMGNFFVIEKKENLNYVIKNGKIISHGYDFINQFSVSNDGKNYYFITSTTPETSSLIYNNKNIYSASGINTDILFYQNTLLFQKENGCYYDTNNKTDLNFCGKGNYVTYVNENYQHKIVLSLDYMRLKIDNLFINSKGKAIIHFLGFSQDGKKVGIRVSTNKKTKTLFIPLK